MDKRFEGLLISVLVHVAIALWFLYAKMPPPSYNSTTEVTLIEKEEKKPKTKTNQIVTETEQKEKFEKDIKEQADFLSQFTKRVKQRLKARVIGEKTQNASNRQAQQQRDQAEENQRLGGIKSNEPGEMDKFHQRQQQMMQVNSGISMIRDTIPGIETGSVTALNTDQFTFYTFYNRSGEQIINRWSPGLHTYVALLTAKLQQELSTRNRTTDLEVLLTPEGQFFRARLEASSGDRGLDEVALQAVREAAPFPHPPREMVRDDGFIHYRMRFTVLFRPPSFGLGGNG